MRRFLLLLLITTLVLAGMRPGRACAPAPGEGEHVQTVEESAIIVWDAARKTQHFIRRATFDTKTRDFGFLVPTPTTPTLAEAKDSAFTHLEALMKPEVRDHVEAGYYWTSWLFPGLFEKEEILTASGVETGAVEVVSAQRVAGYDAVVLKADDAAALVRWLRSHGYTARPTLTQWLRPYVAAQWRITAFKVAKKEKDNPQVASSAVRMSFHTERPFFPYSEPADQRDPAKAGDSPRSLRVLVLGTERMDGGMSAAASANPGPWPGRVAWSNALNADQSAPLSKQLAVGDDQLPGKLWMTAFEDYSTPRPGTQDVYFSRSPAQGPILPEPIIIERDERRGVPIELPLLGVVGGGLGITRAKKKRRQRQNQRGINA